MEFISTTPSNPMFEVVIRKGRKIFLKSEIATHPQLSLPSDKKQ